MTAAQGVLRDLVARYYADGAACGVNASSHWQEFSKHFQVRLRTDGSLESLKGYGFGTSSHTGLLARTFAMLGNAAHLRLLDAPGLGAGLDASRELVQRMGLRFSQDAFRQHCTAWLLERHPALARPPRTILVIGDGHGILAGLLYQRYPQAQIWLVDLGPTLLFQAAHLGRAYPAEAHVLAGSGAGSRGAAFVYCAADQLGSLPEGDVDLAINVASMQEMTVAAIAGYFDLLRQRHTALFYCCNRLEKRLPGGEVLRILEYPWRTDDVHLVDELCPWSQWFVGIGRAKNVRWAGLPLPLVHRYDGRIWHRLTRMASPAESFAPCVGAL
ncbi:MAG: putative sugar O-methyltransferase [Steroidobacteraceae bacterium]